MKKTRSVWASFIIIFMFTISVKIMGREYIIFSIAQEFPMNDEHIDLKKNFYINMGKNQGLQNGGLLDVYRNISKMDPYTTKKRYDFRIKVGELKILHTEDESAIAEKYKLYAEEKDRPYFEVSHFMIGDFIKVKTR